MAQLITSATSPRMHIWGSDDANRAWLRMREIVVVRRLFFLYLGFMRSDTGRPIGPNTAVKGSNYVYILYGLDYIYIN